MKWGSVLKKFFTSEFVTEGHPDKLCDQIADAVLDEIFLRDPDAHVACEVVITKGLVHIMGGISTSCYVDVEKIARSVILDVGYNDSSMGFDGNTCGIILSINTQSPDISRGVNESLETKSVKELKLDYPFIKSYLILAYIPTDKNKSDINRYDDFDDTIYPNLETIPPKYAIIKRNKWMIDRADFLITYVHNEWGGAYRTLSYARKKSDIKICHIF